MKIENSLDYFNSNLAIAKDRFFTKTTQDHKIIGVVLGIFCLIAAAVVAYLYFFPKQAKMDAEVTMGDEKRHGVYEGAVGFFSDEPKGRGKLTLDNGSTYEGYWDKGNLKGPGRCAILGADKKAVMTIDLNPKAVVIKGVPNGPITVSHGNNHYAFNFIKGQRDGLAKYTFENGDVFEILWKNGKCGETAKLIKESGKTYEGNWFPTDYKSSDFEACLGRIRICKDDGIEEFISIEGSHSHSILYWNFRILSDVSASHTSLFLTDISFKE